MPQMPSRRRKWITNAIGLLVALVLAALLISVVVRSAQRSNNSMAPLHGNSPSVTLEHNLASEPLLHGSRD